MNNTQITEYNVIENYKLTKLIELVNREIGLGWLPIGGVCTSPQNGQFYYTQALIKNVPIC